MGLGKLALYQLHDPRRLLLNRKAVEDRQQPHLLAFNGEPKQRSLRSGEGHGRWVLQELAAKYGFEIKGLQNTGSGEALSATMSGSPHYVLSRLLRNRNSMIVRPPDKATGVAKVMILDASYGAAPTKAAQIQSDESAEELLQALSGGSSE